MVSKNIQFWFILHLVLKLWYCIGYQARKLLTEHSQVFWRQNKVTETIILYTLWMGQVRMAVEFLLVLCKDCFGTSWIPAYCILKGNTFPPFWDNDVHCPNAGEKPAEFRQWSITMTDKVWFNIKLVNKLETCRITY